jgi:type VI secretion system FHA domain protein
MILTLEVRGPEAGKLGAASRKVFGATGGTIGRLPDNSWVLPDPYVSSRHALVRYQNGAFTIEDTSTNGVFINSQDNRLQRGEPYVLTSGDRIIIEPYEIETTIAASQDEGRSARFDRLPSVMSSAHDDPFAGLSDAAVVDPLSSSDLDPLKLFDPVKPVSAPPARRAQDLERDSILSEPFDAPISRQPTPQPSVSPSRAPMIPDNYDLSRRDESQIIQAPSLRQPVAPPPPLPSLPPEVLRPEPHRPEALRSDPLRSDPLRSEGLRSEGLRSEALRPEPSRASVSRPAARSPRESRDDASLKEVLIGAGLPDAAVTPELARNLGQILRVVVSGLMDVLQARQRIKEEFRMRVTTFKRADNNPLKFSANVEHALQNLLADRNAAYLEPVEAFEDAFDDLRNHQMAMLAGMRMAFDAMLTEFDPDQLQEKFDRDLKKSGTLMPSKLRYWDLYRDKVHDIVRDPEASFRELFGDEFARAYEEQLERLKAQSRPGKR